MKSFFALIIILVFCFTSCSSVKIEIRDSDEKDTEKILETNSNYVSQTDETENIDKNEYADYTNAIITEEDIYNRTVELSAKTPGIKDEVVYDSAFIPCGDCFFTLGDCNGVYYAVLTNGIDFVKLVEIDVEQFVMLNDTFSDAEIIKNGDVVTIDCKNIGEKFEINFISGNCNHIFCPTEESLETELKTSSNKKYTLWQLNSVGRGDVVSYRLALKNNETGEIRTIEEAGVLGGMYGGYGGAGFFKNNEIYVYSTLQMKVFDPETLKVTFDLNKKFPLSYSDEGEKTLLFSFHRDPNDFSYTVVYSKYTTGERYNSHDSGAFEADYTYQIGFLDKEGNILESFDTEVGVLSDHFGFADVSMRFSDDTITLYANIAELNKIYKIGEFNLKTHTFEKK